MGMYKIRLMLLLCGSLFLQGVSFSAGNAVRPLEGADSTSTTLVAATSTESLTVATSSEPEVTSISTETTTTPEGTTPPRNPNAAIKMAGYNETMWVDRESTFKKTIANAANKYCEQNLESCPGFATTTTTAPTTPSSPGTSSTSPSGTTSTTILTTITSTKDTSTSTSIRPPATSTSTRTESTSTTTSIQPTTTTATTATEPTTTTTVAQPTGTTTVSQLPTTTTTTATEATTTTATTGSTATTTAAKPTTSTTVIASTTTTTATEPTTTSTTTEPTTTATTTESTTATTTIESTTPTTTTKSTTATRTTKSTTATATTESTIATTTTELTNTPISTKPTITTTIEPTTTATNAEPTTTTTTSESTIATASKSISNNSKGQLLVFIAEPTSTPTISTASQSPTMTTNGGTTTEDLTRVISDDVTVTHTEKYLADAYQTTGGLLVEFRIDNRLGNTSEPLLTPVEMYYMIEENKEDLEQAMGTQIEQAEKPPGATDKPTTVDPNPPPPDGLEGWEIALIVIGSLAGAGIIGFLIWKFIIKKDRKDDYFDASTHRGPVYEEVEQTATKPTSIHHYDNQAFSSSDDMRQRHIETPNSMAASRATENLYTQL